MLNPLNPNVLDSGLTLEEQAVEQQRLLDAQLNLNQSLDDEAQTYLEQKWYADYTDLFGS